MIKVINYKGNHPGAQGRMSPGGDPAFLIFGSFDQAKERARKNNLEGDASINSARQKTRNNKMLFLPYKNLQ